MASVDYPVLDGTGATIIPAGRGEGPDFGNASYITWLGTAANARAAAKAMGSPIVLGRSAAAITHTGTTAETALATVPIPADCMGANGLLRVTSLWSLPDANTNSKIARIRLGGISGTPFFFYQNTSATVLTVPDTRIIANRNSKSAQVTPYLAQAYAPVNAAIATGTVNTANAQDLVFSMALANAADTVRLEMYLVELLAKD